MNTTETLTAYSWRVFKNNRFVGYVVSFSQYDAYRKAKDKYGENVWLERLAPSYNG